MTPEQLKISILNAAISGKLTGVCYEDDSDIPRGWRIEKVGNILEIVVGATPSTGNAAYWENGTIPWIPSGSCQNCEVFEAPKYITQLGYDSCSTKLMPINTVLIALTGATAGKVGYLKIEACGNQSVVGILPSTNMIQKYIFYYFLAKRNAILADCVGSAQPHISKAYIVNMNMVIPPLEEQQLIVEKIEETLPFIEKYAQSYNKLERINSSFPVEIRKSILHEAVQGKLVEQKSEEGSAESLYQKIQDEKKKLFEQGKFKKEKPLPEISEDEIPFEIPDSWKWVRLSEICNISDGTHQTPHYVENGMPFISAQNVKPYKFIPEIHRDVSEADFKEYNKVVAPSMGDILMTRVGAGIGEAAIIDQDFEFSIYVSLTLIKPYLANYDMRYLLNVLNSPLGLNLARKKTLGKGASQGNLNLCFIREFVLPLPPLEEQKRIVAKIEELLPLCDRLVK